MMTLMYNMGQRRCIIPLCQDLTRQKLHDGIIAGPIDVASLDSIQKLDCIHLNHNNRLPTPDIDTLPIITPLLVLIVILDILLFQVFLIWLQILGETFPVCTMTYSLFLDHRSQIHSPCIFLSLFRQYVTTQELTYSP